MKRILLILVATLALGGCAFMTGGRCYIDDARYFRMKELFLQTNSLQQVEQSMQDEGWSVCERNEFRYRLNKDLDLEDLVEPETPAPELLP